MDKGASTKKEDLNAEDNGEEKPGTSQIKLKCMFPSACGLDNECARKHTVVVARTHLWAYIRVVA